ncbi:MAG: TolC family protein [Bacteroidota bacterium]
MIRHLFTFIFTLAIGTCLCQEPLSLSDAIQLGLKRNYNILIEEGNVDIASNNNTWGESGRWPSITLNVDQNNNLTDNVRVAFPTATQGQIFSNSLTPAINLNWVMFDGFRVNISKKRLDLLQSESEGNASIVIANTIQSVILGYYLAVLEIKRLEEFKKQLELSRDRYQYVKVKFELGSAVTTDLLLEEGNYLTDSINYINQELLSKNAVRNLNVLLAESDITTQYQFTDSLSLYNDSFELEDLRGKMLGENVDLRRQYLTQSLLGESTSLARADKYPTLSLQAGFSENRNSLDLSEAVFFTGEGFASGPDQRLNSVTDVYAANFSLSFNLFNGGRINRAIKNAMVNEQIGQLRIEQLKTSLDRDLQEAFDRYNLRRRLYAINNRRAEAAQVNLDLSKDKFRNGSINSFDYRDVQNSYLSASILKLQSIYDLIDSKVELMRLTGGLLRTYVE